MGGDKLVGEERVLNEVFKWEKELRDYVTSDFEKLYDLSLDQSFKNLPQAYQDKFYDVIDQWFLYTYTFLQSTAMQNEAVNRVLQVARTYDETIEKVEDLRHLSIEKLTYLADQQIAKNRLYALTQGGLTGSGGFLFLSSDLPVMVALNLRTVQMVGTSFGYNMHHPAEMLLALKVFHAGMLPKRMQYEAWEKLKKNTEKSYSALLNEQNLTDQTWLEQPIQQIFKTIAILSLRKKKFQGIPLLSIGIGATVNYRLARNVTSLAKHFYQYRFIHDKRVK